MTDAAQRPEPAQTRHARLEALDALVKETFQRELRRPFVLGFLQSPVSADRRMYALYLTQVYAYTSHVARNQALVGSRLDNRDTHYQRFCFEHALEETGHELMALHDLRALGVPITDPHTELPPPLPATEQLIAWLYWVSAHARPVARMGFSYWAERAYPYGEGFLTAVQARMKLDRSVMTFWYVHRGLDDKHADDVEKALVQACRTDADWEAVERTATVTIGLCFDMIEQAVRECEKLLRGDPSPYAFLSRHLAPT